MINITSDDDLEIYTQAIEELERDLKFYNNDLAGLYASYFNSTAMSADGDYNILHRTRVFKKQILEGMIVGQYMKDHDYYIYDQEEYPEYRKEY